ncbi:hypothetical protein [Paenibacillus oceani]|uniref:Uncharacterized protein n=1 Tax=Paenibacillus oceani TaxID=2772510 RepID=A0A927CA22_9BACL|nr:hypothetical protein [Paenibacillus oceani]MBD2862226.1 hypothetical protein [Paenibacillus oceani]
MRITKGLRKELLLFLCMVLVVSGFSTVFSLKAFASTVVPPVPMNQPIEALYTGTEITFHNVVESKMTIFGDKAWWMPKWLDRLLLNLDVEGDKLIAELNAKEGAAA